MSHDYKERKYDNKKKNEKAQKVVGDEANFVLSLLTTEIKKKVQFTKNVEKPTEASMVCTIDGDTFFHKNTWIRDSDKFLESTISLIKHF